MNRTGKIAKLPPALREELNHQLERGTPGRILVAWLNAHPEAQVILHEFFEGTPINEQNLSAWRRGGFVDWQTRREFYHHVREAAAGSGDDLEKVAANMAHHAAQLLATHIAIALNEVPAPRALATDSPESSAPDPYAALAARLKPLVALTRTVTALRRSEHDAARLQRQQALAPKSPAAASTTTNVRCDSAPSEPADHS